MTPEINAMLDRSNDVIGGWWGNHIRWKSDQTFDFEKQKTFGAWGHKPPDQRLELGHLVAGEFQKSWILFEVVDIEYARNPPDMFFADLKPIDQVKKPSH